MRKIVTHDGATGDKDASGAYIKPPPRPVAPEPDSGITLADISIDNLMQTGLESIYLSMRFIKDAAKHAPTRENIQNLKDLMAMLRDLKKDEKEILSNMTDEELERYAVTIQNDST